MTSPRPVLLISDACVLIDFCKAGCLDRSPVNWKMGLPIAFGIGVLLVVTGVVGLWSGSWNRQMDRKHIP